MPFKEETVGLEDWRLEIVEVWDEIAVSGSNEGKYCMEFEGPGGG